MNKILIVCASLTLAGLSPLLAQQPHDADNTSRNKQDRNGKFLTPADQSNAEADLLVVQSIRKALVAKDDLSVNAKNVKVITNDKSVVLRGPVKSAQEKKVIEQIAKDNAGTRKIENLIEIETQQ